MFGLKSEPQGPRSDPQGLKSDLQGFKTDAQCPKSDFQGPNIAHQDPKSDPQGPKNEHGTQTRKSKMKVLCEIDKKGGGWSITQKTRLWPPIANFVRIGPPGSPIIRSLASCICIVKLAFCPRV